MAAAIMDEKINGSISETEAVDSGESAAQRQGRADTTAATAETVAEMPGSTIPATARSLDLNDLQEFSDKKLKALARDLDLYLHPARSRHQHILEDVLAAFAARATVTGGAFLHQVSRSFAMLRVPKLNFLPVPDPG